MYDYKEGKKRVEEIFKSNLEVKENERIPKSEVLTFDNSYHTWVAVSSLIFVIHLIFLKMGIIKKYLNSSKLSLPN